MKYILDFESVIGEIEEIKAKAENNFFKFKGDFTLKRATERDLEIVGEAVRMILELDVNVSISSARKIIGLRNLTSHAYDYLEEELI